MSLAGRTYLANARDAGATLGHLDPDTDVAARVYAGMGIEETGGIDIYRAA